MACVFLNDSFPQAASSFWVAPGPFRPGDLSPAVPRCPSASPVELSSTGRALGRQAFPAPPSEPPRPALFSFTLLLPEHLALLQELTHLLLTLAQWGRASHSFSPFTEEDGGTGGRGACSGLSSARRLGFRTQEAAWLLLPLHPLCVLLGD